MLHHANINTIIGACVEPNNLYVLSPYCSKGSLSDVLENDNIKMDNIFKLSFASDIAQVRASTQMVFEGEPQGKKVLSSEA